MTVRYDALLARGLADELGRALAGVEVAALVLDRGRRLAVLRLADGRDLQLHLDPGAGFILLGPGRRVPGEARALRGLRVVGCEAPIDERVLLLSLGPADRESHARIAVELRSDGRNALLLDEEGRIELALCPRLSGGEARPGSVYTPPSSGRAWLEALPTEEAWLNALGGIQVARRRSAALRTVGWLSPLNVDAVLGAARHSEDETALGQALERYGELRARREAWQLERKEGLQPYPMNLWEDSARRAGSLLDAMAASAEAALPSRVEALASPRPRQPGTAHGQPPSGEALRRALQARLRRAERRRAALERQLAGSDAESLRSQAHLLLARQAEVPRGQVRVRLTGFDGRPVEIELDPALGAVDNAERLYERARRRERAARRLPAEIRRAKSRVARLRSALDQLDSEGESGELWRLAGSRGVARPGRHAPPSEAPLPYRRLRSSGGLEIRIGRGARANDDLTFHHAAPEDIWLHARQVPGAHVVLRWGRRDENPPQRDLAEAAVAAAVHSDARHSGTVAVDWTRRKYVRKPRGAPPGAVVPERVKTLFVEPDPRLLEGLRPDE